MEYTKKEISEMQGMMRGAADVNVQVEILAQIYGVSGDARKVIYWIAAAVLNITVTF